MTRQTLKFLAVVTEASSATLSGFHRVSWFAFTAVVVILPGSTQLPENSLRADHYRSENLAAS
jgi:hypothetical protein